MLLLMQWQVPTELKPSAGMILRMTFDLLLGLSTMHELGVVHRDMKPSNIGIVLRRLVALDPGLASDGDELVEHPAVTGEQGNQVFIRCCTTNTCTWCQWLWSAHASGARHEPVGIIDQVTLHGKGTVVKHMCHLQAPTCTWPQNWMWQAFRRPCCSH